MFLKFVFLREFCFFSFCEIYCQQNKLCLFGTKNVHFLFLEAKKNFKSKFFPTGERKKSFFGSEYTIDQIYAKMKT